MDENDVCHFERKRYQKGFMLKCLPLAEVCLEDVNPSTADLDNFCHNFHVGDNVKISEGELQHLEGKIVKIDDSTITIEEPENFTVSLILFLNFKFS